MIKHAGKHPYKSYALATQTLATAQQIVLVYDGAIRFMQQAKNAIAEKRIEDRYRALSKASELVMGMQSCLDFEHGEAMADLLYSFYTSIDSRICAIHRSNDSAACDELITELRKMRDIWRDIDAKNSSGETSIAPSAPISGERAVSA